jgi:hypothetical protein
VYVENGAANCTSLWSIALDFENGLSRTFTDVLIQNVYLALGSARIIRVPVKGI